MRALRVIQLTRVPSLIHGSTASRAMQVRSAALILLLIVAAVGGYFFARPSGASGASGDTSATMAQAQAHARLLSMRGDWTSVSRGKFEIGALEEGELRPVIVTSLSFLSPGKIGFLVPEGTYVKKGERVVALETKELEDAHEVLHETLAAADVELAQQEQTRDLELKRLNAELQTEKENTAFAALKLREILLHPNKVEEEEARNFLDEAKARLDAAETDLTSYRPLFDKGFGTKEELQLREVAFEKAKIEKVRADMKARVIRDGALPDDRTRAELDKDFAALGLKVKTLDNEDLTDTLELAVKTAARKVSTFKQSLEKSRVALERSTLHAPHDGVVVYRQMGYRGNKKPEVGERVSPWIAPLDLPSYERMKVRTQVPESLVRKIHARTQPSEAALKNGEKAEPGSRARVAITTIPGVIYSAQVTWIDGWARDRNSKLADADIKAQGLSGVKVFDVEVELDESDPKHLREGFRATVEFPEETLEQVIAIPEQAVSTIDGVSSVMVMEGFSPAARTITLGRASRGKVVVASGLKEREQIFVPRIDRPVAPLEKKGADKKGPKDTGKKNSSPKNAPKNSADSIKPNLNQGQNKVSGPAGQTLIKEAL